MAKGRLFNGFIHVVAVCAAFCFVFSLGGHFNSSCLAEDEEIELKGVLLASADDRNIKSPWGDLKDQQLLLNQDQRVSLENNNLKIIFGLTHWDKESASYVGDNLKFSSLYVAKSPVSVKLFQEEETGKWCATDGMLGISEDDSIVFEGLKIIVIGGAGKPVKIAGAAFSDTTVVIKEGKPVKLSE